MIQDRTRSGKFAAKSDSPRRVRSVRLTDSTWTKINWLASDQGVTAADFLESVDWDNLVGQNADLSGIRELLEAALKLPANKGGAIKAVIREVLELLPQ